MIVLKTLRWSNAFSYGANNEISLNTNQITQLLGKNGHGKSSIGLILEEVLYNKNSKGIKKADIINRYIDAKSYTIEVEFDKDGDAYVVKSTRGTSQTIKFYKNNEDISAHTATNTLKLIEETLGIDHKTFSQLIYQSSSSSLEFLTATDTNRKKFLIDLLNLSKYVEAFEIFKALAKEVQDDVTQIESSMKTTKSWLDKNLKEDLEVLPLLEINEQSTVQESTELAELQAQVKNIDSTNKRITQNNQYIKLRDAIPLAEISKKVEQPQSTTALITERAQYQNTIKTAKAFIKKIQDLGDSCPTCLQSIDKEQNQQLVSIEQEKIQTAEEIIQSLDAKIKELESLKVEFDKVTKYKSDFETYANLVDETIDNNLLDKDELLGRITTLQEYIDKTTAHINKLQAENAKRVSHNAKVEHILEQSENMKQELLESSNKLKLVTERLTIIQLLQKTFSTNGLLAYKIECLVKDLENLTNKYLGDLSSGRFQLSFIVVSDKLNVVITDNGKDIDILALSSGERARVNTATLIAIRKLMQTISDSRINLLILDETVENLDLEGKEKLIEVLLQEENLNTILISHGFSHPLLEKITVIKENNISRIES